jgi:hypothetical protein
MSGIKKRDPASIVHMGSQTQLTGLDQIYLTVLSYRCSSVRRSPGADIICMPAKNRSLNKERCCAKKENGVSTRTPTRPFRPAVSFIIQEGATSSIQSRKRRPKQNALNPVRAR